MSNYKKELALRVKVGGSFTIEKVEAKKRGHPYLLGEKMDRQLQEYMKSLREAKAVINSASVIQPLKESLRAVIVTYLSVMVVTSSVQNIGQSTF